MQKAKGFKHCSKPIVIDWTEAHHDAEKTAKNSETRCVPKPTVETYNFFEIKEFVTDIESSSISKSRIVNKNEKIGNDDKNEKHEKSSEQSNENGTNIKVKAKSMVEKLRKMARKNPN